MKAPSGAFIPNTAPHSRGVGGRVPYKIAPVDVYGCPPRPEGLMYGLLMFHQKIRHESLRDAHRKKEFSSTPNQLNLSPETIE